MKAEHRKELHTNILADRMGKLVQGFKAGPKGTSATYWVIGVLAVIALIAWYFASGAGRRVSEGWVELSQQPNADHPIGPDYREVIKSFPGTVPARTARFQEARQSLRNGLSAIFSTANHGQGVKDLTDARDQFKQLAAECQGISLLEQEALLGQAKAEEALAGAKQGESDQYAGSLDQALKVYQRLASKFPDSQDGKEAKKRADQLQDPAARARIDQFYKDMGNRFAKAGDDNKGLPSLPFPESNPTP